MKLIENLTEMIYYLLHKEVCMKRLIFATLMVLAITFVAFSQAADTLSVIAIYQGEKAGTGPGLTSVKMSVGEEVILTAKGMDEKGNEVIIAPTWKSDKEISLTTVEGKGRSIKAKLLKAPSGLAYITCVVVTDSGKKMTGEVTVEVKKEK